MSGRGRINHIVNALRQSGFYSENEPASPGEITPAVLQALQSFMEYKGEDGEEESRKQKRINRVINALRTTESNIFRGIHRNCCTMKDDLKKAIETYIAKMQSLAEQRQTETA